MSIKKVIEKYETTASMSRQDFNQAVQKVWGGETPEGLVVISPTEFASHRGLSSDAKSMIRKEPKVPDTRHRGRTEWLPSQYIQNWDWNNGGLSISWNWEQRKVILPEGWEDDRKFIRSVNDFYTAVKEQLRVTEEGWIVYSSRGIVGSVSRQFGVSMNRAEAVFEKNKDEALRQTEIMRIRLPIASPVNGKVLMIRDEQSVVDFLGTKLKKSPDLYVYVEGYAEAPQDPDEEVDSYSAFDGWSQKDLILEHIADIDAFEADRDGHSVMALCGPFKSAAAKRAFMKKIGLSSRQEKKNRETAKAYGTFQSY